MSADMDQKKVNYEKNKVIVLQGDIISELIVLSQGSVELSRCQENIKGYTSDEVIKRSRRIEIINAPAILAAEYFLNAKASNFSYVAATNVVTTKVNLGNLPMANFFRAKPQLAYNILCSMKDNCIRHINLIKSLTLLSGELEKLSDNLELLYAVANADSKNELLSTFVSNGGQVPASIDTSFLINDYSALLGKDYAGSDFDPKDKYQWKKLEFVHQLLKAKPQAFLQIIATQVQVFMYIQNELGQILLQIAHELGKLTSKLEEKIDTFFNDKYSILNQILSKPTAIFSSKKIDANIAKAVIAIIKNLDTAYKKISGKEHSRVYPKLEALSKASTNVSKTDLADEEEEYVSKFKSKLIGSRAVIAKFAGLANAETEKIIKNIDKIDKIDFKESSDKESRKIIKELQVDYFHLLTPILLKAVQGVELPFAVRLFLYFGFIDEGLLTDKEIDGLCEALPQFEKLKDLDYPIITLVDYLRLIYEEEEVPGLSMNGEEFSKLARRANPRTPVDESPKGKVIFEIENMIKEGMRVTSDNPRAFFPYLTSHSIRGDLKNVLNIPNKLDVQIKQINDIDPSLFFRELTWKAPGKSELIRKEVKPFLILVPNSGVRIQLWQEIVNNSRSTRARLIIPTIFNDSLDKSLIHTFANFRWELNKMIAGANWMDPVEGGFVGAFYDFSQYYQKNSELSLEAKEEIKLLFNKIKIDRERFAFFYERWLVQEKEGIAKINKAVRAIFYRYIPFPKEIRERLRNLPLYEHLDTKFNNIRRREYRSLEAKYHKHAKNGVLPEDLEAYLELLRK